MWVYIRDVIDENRYHKILHNFPIYIKGKPSEKNFHDKKVSYTLTLLRIGRS